MIKIFIYIILFISFLSCKNETEFIQSKVNKRIILIKNIPNEQETRMLLKEYIYKNKISNNVSFYKYDIFSTKYFINNKEDYTGGLSANEISFYKEFGIAELNIIKINKKECKIKSEIRYLNDKYGNYYNPDTLIYHCN